MFLSASFAAFPKRLELNFFTLMSGLSKIPSSVGRYDKTLLTYGGGGA